MWLKQGQIEVDGGDESDCGSGECGDGCGDGHAEETSPAGIPFPTKLPSLHPIPNQSKPIVPLLSFSFIITSSYIFIITFSYIFITSSYISIAFSYNLQLYLHNLQL